jgi:hypothetical protein
MAVTAMAINQKTMNPRGLAPTRPCRTASKNGMWPKTTKTAAREGDALPQVPATDPAEVI